MRKHIELAKLAPLKHEHFERWIEIFSQTVNELFKGDNANRIIEYAKTIRENLELRTREVA